MYVLVWYKATVILNSEESAIPNNVSKRITRAELDRLVNALPDVSMLHAASGMSSLAISLPTA